jgi:thioredoxin-like negative regulator of GroEL
MRSLCPMRLVALAYCVAVDVAAFREISIKSCRNQRKIQTSSIWLRSPILDTIPSSTQSTSSQLSAYKFKNVDDMLNAFREEPVVIYFTSVTCGPCRLQMKELAHVRELVGVESAFKVVSIDTKKWPHVGSKFSIGRLPCLLLMKDKEVLVRLEGLTKAEELVEKVYSNAINNRLQ